MYLFPRIRDRALPSKAKNTKQVKINQLTEQIQEVAEKTNDLKKQKRKAEETRTAKDRPAKLQKLQSELQQQQQLTTELSKYAASDPERIELLKKNAKICKDSANRWT